MRYLVTGGCGFVGSNLAAEVLHRGEELIVFDNLSREGSSANLAWLREAGEFKFAHGDIRNTSDVDRVVRSVKPDFVFHLAGQVAMTTSVENPLKDFETNALGTVALLEAVRRYCPEAAVLYSSTNKVYGDLEWLEYQELDNRYKCVDYPDGLPESIPLDFSTPYGCSKGSADQYIRDYHRMYGLRTAVFRHSSMYGGRQFPTVDQGWVGWFVKQALLKKSNQSHTFTVSGNGKQVRDLLHAKDVVDLYFAAARCIDEIQGEVFNVGGGKNNALSILDLLQILSASLEIELLPTFLSARERDQKWFVADTAKINRSTGWDPVVAHENGVLDMVNWIQVLGERPKQEK